MKRAVERVKRSARGLPGRLARRGVPGPERTATVDVAAARIVVVIPAHDEEALIALTLDSIEAQTRRPDRMIVMADNCTDRTEEIVRARPGWEAWSSTGNRDKKAGALNQAWERLEREGGLGPDDLLLVVDADTELTERFIENAAAWYGRRPGIGGVCGNFHGKPGGGVLGAFQRMEYARFARALARRGGATFVLSGTASLFRASVLRELHAARGHVYDPTSMVEDYELSLALRHRGYACVAPPDCRVHTDVMPTVRELRAQRVRWQRGTLEELRRYGATCVTNPDIARQGLLGAALLSRFAFVAMIAATLSLAGELSVQWEWTALTAVVAVERAISVRELGWRYALTAVLVVPEELYGLLREAFFVKSAWLALQRGAWTW